eukprot:TRINITY_DN12523_c0_g1_i1.p1 TRINITY_DN12523_c0_g1~~TRINITY_DN12523_c0_g1_i1.p1  ORF type:complete len:118 (-),score=15.66 TRINITY_DN12523_c0_g1_i1:239-592(-)
MSSKSDLDRSGASCADVPSEESARFKLEADVGGKPGDSRATYVVPKGWADRLSERPISANGALFELRPAVSASSDCDAVQVVFYSPKPERTAEAIGKVIAKRLLDPDGPEMKECVIS